MKKIVKKHGAAARPKVTWITDCQVLPKASGNRFSLFQGDALEILKELPDNSIDACLTSPPYWQARDYNGLKEQVGQEPDVTQYISSIVSVFNEVYRLLKPNGTVWLNIGDKYLSGVGTVAGKPPRYGWRRNKQLSLVPFRLAIALQDAGWWVRNTVVWHKPNGMPISATDRFANHWEPIFLLTKSEKYHFNVDPLRVPHKTSDLTEKMRAKNGGNNGKSKGRPELRQWLNSPRHRATIDGLLEVERRPNAPAATELAAYLRSAAERRNLTIKHIAGLLGLPFERTRHYFRTDEIGSRLPPNDIWHKLKELLDLDGRYDEAMEVEIGDNIFRNHPLGRNPGDVTSVAIGPSEFGHFATMPFRLAEWTLKATLPKGGVCLDPFCGTGTTGEAALRLGGRFLGVDIDAEALSFAAERLSFLDEPQISAQLLTMHAKQSRLKDDS